MKKNKQDEAQSLQDWERSICERIDRILEEPDNRGYVIDQLLDYIEDLIVNAYLRGKQVAVGGGFSG